MPMTENREQGAGGREEAEKRNLQVLEGNGCVHNETESVPKTWAINHGLCHYLMAPNIMKIVIPS